MNWIIILNVMIAMFLYNILLKAIANAILKWMFKSSDKEVLKTFKERLNDKLNEDMMKD
jgi:hypothetical protein